MGSTVALHVLKNSVYSCVVDNRSAGTVRAQATLRACAFIFFSAFSVCPFDLLQTPRMVGGLLPCDNISNCHLHFSLSVCFLEIVCVLWMWSGCMRPSAGARLAQQLHPHRVQPYIAWRCFRYPRTF